MSIYSIVYLSSPYAELQKSNKRNKRDTEHSLDVFIRVETTTTKKEEDKKTKIVF